MKDNLIWTHIKIYILERATTAQTILARVRVMFNQAWSRPVVLGAVHKTHNTHATQVDSIGMQMALKKTQKQGAIQLWETKSFHTVKHFTELRCLVCH